jgi:hypothetical protein
MLTELLQVQRDWGLGMLIRASTSLPLGTALVGRVPGFVSCLPRARPLRRGGGEEKGRLGG